MNRSTKIAISLPEHILKVIEIKRKASGESRSRFFQLAVEQYLKQQQDLELTETYIQGYRQMPESKVEIETAHRSGVTVLSREDW